MTNDNDTNSPGFFAYLVGASLLFFFLMQFRKDGPTTGKEIVAGFQTISDTDTDSLINLSTQRLRQKLGKPYRVDFPRRQLVLQRGQDSGSDTPDEIWVYYRKVKHKASGAKMNLSCEIKHGKCVGVKIH
ncbi:MAG TPA: hypothetical protein DDZ51_05325 [Planctomycetaceae bacterium]|jgi:hypothetical protein|nr:hypothetical protein [Planctomycetaceae bacterium]